MTDSKPAWRGVAERSVSNVKQKIDENLLSEVRSNIHMSCIIEWPEMSGLGAGTMRRLRNPIREGIRKHVNNEPY